ncbi:MAG: T9SS type A sorting domain-containing protein [Bacteroidota bacterium]
MKAHFYLLFFLLFLGSITSAQTVEWIGQFSSPSGVNIIDMSQDAQGNIYLCGTFGDSADFDPGPDVFELLGTSYVAKLDANGDLVWAKSFNGFGVETVRPDNDGNVIIGFAFFQTIDFDPGPSVQNISPSGDTDILILKLDVDGNFVWANQISGTSTASPNDLAIASDGSIVVTGNFRSTPDFDPGPGTNTLTAFGGSDCYVLKLDNDGIFQWVRQFGGSAFEYGAKIALDDTDQIYVLGEFFGTADFDPGAGTMDLSPQGSSDMFFMKLSASGSVDFVTQFGSTVSQFPETLRIEDDGFAYVSGGFSGSGDFDPGTGTFDMTALGDRDGFICKLMASSGDLVWARQFGATQADVSTQSVAVTSDGTVFSTGSFSATPDFDPGADEFLIAGENLVDFDIFISRLNQDGDFECATGFVSLDTQLGLHLLSTDSDELIMSGVFEGTVDFDPGPGVLELTNNGESGILSNNGVDAFILQLGLDACPPVSVFDPVFAEEIDLFPNPTSGQLRIELNDTYADLTIRVIDVMGRIVDIQAFQFLDQIDLDLNGASGMYFIELSTLEKRTILKVIKE